MELEESNENKLEAEFTDPTSILKSHPPVIKYDFRKIGAHYAKQLQE